MRILFTGSVQWLSTIVIFTCGAVHYNWYAGKSSAYNRRFLGTSLLNNHLVDHCAVPKMELKLTVIIAHV
jgi:hypothetical protein